MARLLVVDDEEKIRLIIRKYAEAEGHTVTEAGDGREAVALCAANDFDVVIMDIMMPGMDGFKASREILGHKNIPIIMLSARGEEYDRIRGFEIGADDYVVKPFSPKELMMRVKVVTNRGRVSDKSSNPEESHDIYRLGSLVIDFTARKVSADGNVIELTPKEYDLLFFLVQNRNVALGREQLITKVWGYDYYGDDRTLDTHIKRLRQSLGSYRDCIVTLRGVGYRFDEQIPVGGGGNEDAVL